MTKFVRSKYEIIWLFTCRIVKVYRNTQNLFPNLEFTHLVTNKVELFNGFCSNQINWYSILVCNVGCYGPNLKLIWNETEWAFISNVLKRYERTFPRARLERTHKHTNITLVPSQPPTPPPSSPTIIFHYCFGLEEKNECCMETSNWSNLFLKVHRFFFANKIKILRMY